MLWWSMDKTARDRIQNDIIIDWNDIVSDKSAG